MKLKALKSMQQSQNWKKWGIKPLLNCINLMTLKNTKFLKQWLLKHNLGTNKSLAFLIFINLYVYDNEDSFLYFSHQEGLIWQPTLITDLH